MRNKWQSTLLGEYLKIGRCVVLRRLARKTPRLVDKKLLELEVGEITSPRRSGRYSGVSIGRDKKGYYVCTHRARSESYLHASDIPTSKIKWIESTGTVKQSVPLRR